MSMRNRFGDFLHQPKDDGEPRCWVCNKSEEDILAKYEEAMNRPENTGKEIDFEELLVMTHKTKKPICAACYFQIKNNKELIDEIFKRPENEIWDLEE